MESSFTWLDNSDRDRQRAQEALRLFLDEETTRDELGLGSVNKAFANMLFPGTSTAQTRARYFLLVPWIYQRLEDLGVESERIEDRARDEECRLIDVLCKSEDTDGVIGKKVRGYIKRLPSNRYWAGLGKLGIRRFPGLQREYHRSLDRFYERNKENFKPDGDDNFSQAPDRNWHALIPEPPDDFPEVGDISLRKEDAEYLRERIRTEVGVRDTLLGYYAKHISDPDDWPDGDRPDRFFWELRSNGLPGELKNQVHHARCFSEVLYGAALLYNLMLTEIRVRELGYDEEDCILAWKERLGDWVRLVKGKGRRGVLRKWDEAEFWKLVKAAGGVSHATKIFVSKWIKWVKEHLSTLSLDDLDPSGEAGRLVRKRETKRNGPKSKFSNRQYLELWKGASKASQFGQLDFRWGHAWRILQDIRLGLQGQED